jgi:hypothetical protein
MTRIPSSTLNYNTTSSNNNNSSNKERINSSSNLRRITHRVTMEEELRKTTTASIQRRQYLLREQLGTLLLVANMLRRCRPVQQPLRLRIPSSLVNQLPPFLLSLTLTPNPSRTASNLPRLPLDLALPLAPPLETSSPLYLPFQVTVPLDFPTSPKVQTISSRISLMECGRVRASTAEAQEEEEQSLEG